MKKINQNKLGLPKLNKNDGKETMGTPNMRGGCLENAIKRGVPHQLANQQCNSMYKKPEKYKPRGGPLSSGSGIASKGINLDNLKK